MSDQPSSLPAEIDRLREANGALLQERDDWHKSYDLANGRICELLGQKIALDRQCQALEAHVRRQTELVCIVREWFTQAGQGMLGVREALGPCADKTESETQSPTETEAKTEEIVCPEG